MEPTNRTAAGDQYSLGCIFYYFLAGRYPFPEGSAVEKMMSHQYKQPTPIKELVPEISPELQAVVERLMQKKPEDRYASCEEAVEALRPLAATAAPQVKRPVAKPQQPQPSAAPDNGMPMPSNAPAKRGAAPARPTAGPAPAPTTSKTAASARGDTSRPAAGPSRGAAPTGPGAGAGAGAAARSLRGNLGLGAGGPAPAAPPKRELPPEEDEEEEEVEDSGEEEEEEEEYESDDEEGRFGTVAIVLGAVILCGLAFYLAFNLFKH
jgi:serine/threonine-protein kinase